MGKGYRVFETIVFAQGDDYQEAEDAAERAAGYEPEGSRTVVHSGTREWLRGMFEHLRQWDNGEPTGDESEREPWGSADTVVYFSPAGAFMPYRAVPRNGYALGYSTSYGYAGLTRITWRDEAR